MILLYLEIFFTYCLVSLVLRLVLQILPPSLRKPFEGIIFKIRQTTSKFIVSLFGEEDNLEVNLLAFFITPFVLILAMVSVIQYIVITNPEYVATNIFYILFAVIALSLMVPTNEELAKFSDPDQFSVLAVIIKIFLVVQLFMSLEGEIIPIFGLFILIIPLSAVLKV